MVIYSRMQQSPVTGYQGRELSTPLSTSSPQEAAESSEVTPRPPPLQTRPPTARNARIHPTGKLFVLSDGEGKHTTVELSEPLDEEISGVIEVVGRVTNQATIMCMSYVQFREDKSPFDLELYNEALKIIHEFPEYFPFGAGRNN
nr:PREDICTED: replication protein A 14 kDa subunit [Opisthocomus hoazin]